MNDNLLVYNAHSLNSEKGLSYIKIIQDIENIKPKNVLFLSHLEYEIPHVIDKSEYDTLEKLISDYDVNFFILIGAFGFSNLEDFQKKRNFTFLTWPTSYLHYYHSRVKENLAIQKSVNNFEKLYRNLNGKARYHRVKLVDKLFHNNLFEDGIITWNELTKDYNEGRKCEFEYWKEKILTIDDNNYFSNLENNNFLIDLVSETTSSHEFITEKTFRPIILKQIFLCLGHKNINNNLKKLGFELYDEIFDYSFDVESDLDKRIDGIIKNLKTLKNRNLNDLYEIVQEKIKYNENKYKEIIENDLFIPKVFIDLYKKYRYSFGEYLQFYGIDCILKNK